jgi:hypothetical protein
MTTREKYIEIIKLFIDLEEFPINWGKECFLAKKATEMYPDINFWRFIHKNTNLTLRLPSLAWFFTPKGKDCLKREYNKFSVGLSEKKSYNIEDQYAVEIPKTEKKNILDFIEK